MPHRRNHHARTAALTITTLTTVGLGLATASPASAAPSPQNSIDAAQSRVDRLSDQADTAAGRHRQVESALTRQRARASKLTAGIRRHQQQIEALRTQVASEVVDQTTTGGASVVAPSLSHDSTQLLTNVTIVSEDTGGRVEAITASGVRVQELARARAATREKLAGLRRTEQTLEVRHSRADARLTQAGTILAGLEKKAAAQQRRAAAEQQKAAAARIAESGGPVVAFVKSQVGKAYVYGAAGPSAFDCSGLTMMAWQQAGVSLPHSSSAQYASGTHVSESELQPGDLVFYYSPISHVGLYIGGGKIVNALNPSSGVQISGLHDMPYSGAVRPG